MRESIIVPEYDHYKHLPKEDKLLNLLSEDIPRGLREDSELAEFYKLSNEYYSPIFGIKYLLNINIYPYQMAIIRAILAHKFPIMLLSRGAGKTFILAVYAIYHAVMFPGSRIVLVSASFRQSKLIFAEIEKIFRNSPLLRSISEDQPRISTDHCHYEVHGSSIKALPLGGGDKIRGERGHVILTDEFDSVPIEVFDVVVRGFGATQVDPWSKTRDILTTGKKEEKKKEFLSSGNKIVLSGTAGFKNGTFYRMYSQYSRILSNKIKGKARDYQDVFKDDKLDDSFEIDYRDYCIINFNYKEMPPGMMDVKVIDNARATMPKFLFDMEYMCFKGDTLVITNTGAKEISAVKAGDLVLTHKGRFRRVTEIIQNHYRGPVIDYKTWGYNKNCVVTGNHPFWHDNSWKPIESIEDHTALSNLKTLNNKGSIDLRDYTHDFTQRGGKIFPRASQTKLDNDDISSILTSTGNNKMLAGQYGVCLSTIYDVKSKAAIPKTAIPYDLPLNFDLGLIVGYYASEGSVGAHGKATCFSLDGHVGETLESYVSQLTSAIHRTIGIIPKHYKKQNITTVTINQRLFADFIKKICPGIAATKSIDPEILFSNEEFIKGIIVGYWNGDGHISLDSSVVKASSVSIDLIVQMRLILSYFGITACIRHVRAQDNNSIRGRVIKSNDQWSIELHGKNAEKFRRIFYGQQVSCSLSKKYTNDGESSLFSLKEKRQVLYDGIVYNLEVEDDHSYSLLNATVHNCEFADDSYGFFKMKDIENATASRMGFTLAMKGSSNRNYVMGVDPARTVDRFAIVVIEIGAPNKIVHVWTCQNKPYSFSAAKMRELMRKFNIKGIAMDQGGGGLAVEELLNKSDVMLSGEKKLYRIDDESLESNNGSKILHMFSFDSNWIDEANTLLQKNIEDRSIMFPYNSIDGEYTDEKDDMLFEFSELKQELVSIEVTHTKTGKKHYDLAPPDIRKDTSGAVKHKDRYSALLLANYLASRFDKLTIDDMASVRDAYNKSCEAGGWLEQIGT